MYFKNNKMKKYLIKFFLIINLLLIFLISKTFAENNAKINWLTSAGNEYSHRFFSGDQINFDNINNLEKIWTFNSGNSSISNTVQSPPIFVDNQLILVTLNGDLVSISPKDGSVIWKKKIETPLGRRGITFHDTENKNTQGLYVSSGKKVYRLNLKGEVLDIFQTGLSLLQPFIHEKIMYVATLREGVKAFDIISKKQIWSTSFQKNNVNSRVWSGFSFDKKTKSLFVVTSNPGGIIGKNRIGDDYSVSLISLSSETGKIKWQYKHIVNDIWDYDLISNPIIIKNLNLPGKNNLVDAVIALSKTGDLIFVDIKNGKPVFENSYSEIKVNKSDIENVYLSPTQKLYLRPEKFSNIDIDLEKDFSHLDKDNKKYMKNKLRHAKSGFFVPTSLNYDAIIYGVHGGAEWPGATLYRDDINTNIIIPSNKTPWILRVQYQEKKYTNILNHVQSLKNFQKKLIEKINNIQSFFINDNKKENISPDANSLTKKDNYKILDSKSIDTAFKNRTNINDYFPDTKFKKMRTAELIYSLFPNSFNNNIYKKHCISCHGKARQGRYEHETMGDDFYPSLVGLTHTDKYKSYNTYEKLKKIHRVNNINLEINEKEFNDLMNSFRKYDEKLFEDKKYELEGFWQILLDKDGLPATKPPWGYLTNINLINGKKIWQVPFGERIINKKKIIGDQNFGGVMSTKSKIIFATGTPDSFAYAYNMVNGNQIWQSELPYSGSAPPMAFSYMGCDVIIFTSTGGRFVGYKKNGDATVAFKLKTCNFK